MYYNKEQCKKRNCNTMQYMTAGPIIWLHHCCGIGMLLSFTCFDFFHSFNADQLVWQFYTYIIVRSIRIENCSRNRCVYTDDLTPWDLKGSPVKTGEKGLCRGGRGVEHYQINVVCQNDPLNLKKWGYNHSKTIGPAILSYFIYFTCENRWKGVYRAVQA